MSNRNETAFPVPYAVAWENAKTPMNGMSLRDWFAGKAMQGLIASNDDGAGDRIAEIPAYAYHIADSMLETREK